MATAEQVIRNALLKIDSSDVSQRRFVYEFAWNAQERALLSDPSLNDESRNKRRNALMQIIRGIEHDYVQPEENNQSDIILKLNANGPEEQVKLDAGSVDNLASKNSHRALARRRSKLLLIVMPSILAIAMVIGFTAWSFFNSMSGRSIVEHRNPVLSQTGSPITLPQPQSTSEKDDGWIKFFYPGDATAITNFGRISVDIRNDAGLAYTHISANSDEDIIVIEIGAGALANLRGKKAIIDINAKSDGASSSQMSITCDMGNNVDCGRRRFEVSSNRNDFLFNVDIPAGSTGPAKLYLAVDLLGEGNAIDIYGMKIKAAD